jgi:hypothetical protein
MVAQKDKPLLGAKVPNKIPNGIPPIINGIEALTPASSSCFFIC